MTSISVILPTFDRAYCLHRAVRSVLWQTYQDWELIIVDDGSTDSTASLCDKYKQTLGSRFTFLQQDHRGVSAARNLGISHAGGQYVAFLDSDDFWYSEKLGFQLQMLRHNPAAAFCFTRTIYFDDDGGFLEPKPFPVLYEGLYPALLEIKHNIITTPSVLVKTESLRRTTGFDESMRVCEDIDLWTRIAQKEPVFAINALLVGAYLRDEQEYPFLASVLGRHQLYQRAVLANAALKGEFERSLYVELMETICSVATRNSYQEIAAILHQARDMLLTGMEPTDAILFFERQYASLQNTACTIGSSN